MRLPARTLVLMTGAVLWAGLVFAAEGHAASNPWLSLLWKTINFLVLIGLIYYFARKPVGAYLRSTAELVKATLGNAREAKQAAEAELAAQQRKIDGLQAELERMIQQAREDSEKEKQILLAEAEAQAERIVTQMRLQVEQEFSKATTELKRQIADEMVRNAEELIAKRLDGTTNEKIVEEFIEKLEERR